MRILLALVILFATASSSRAQTNKENNELRTLDLDEVRVKSSPDQHRKNKVRLPRHNTHFFVFTKPASGGSWEKRYFLTKFPPLGEKDFLLRGVNCRFSTLGTSKLGVYIVLFQVLGGDTLLRTLATVGNFKREGKWYSGRFSLEEAQRIVPGTFYLGYRFRPKLVDVPCKLEVYLSTLGEGITLEQTPAGLIRSDSKYVSSVFPFQITFQSVN